MANFTAADVKKLREVTGAGMMDCKKALEETDGDFDKAIELLRVKGAAKAAKRGAEREASAGLVATSGAPWSSSSARPTSSPRARTSSPRPSRSRRRPTRPRPATPRR